MPESNTRFNVISETGDGAGFAIRLKAEGYPVRMWIREKVPRSVADNMVEKVGDVEDLIDDAELGNDVFLFDVSGNGVVADYLRDQGFPVLGGSVLCDKLERDRDFGYRIMESNGIAIPETKSFTDFERAADFVSKHADRRWVYKPSKQLGDVSGSHVSYDAEDLIQMLENISRDIDMANPQFELQSYEEGVALSTELWFQHGELIEPMTNHTLERKESMNDDLGKSGGCSGNLTWFCQGCKVCDLVRGLSQWATRERYHGPLDLNAIVAGKAIYGLEFTPRFGYDATPTLLFELVRGGLGPFFEAAARGQVNKFDLREGFAGGIRVTVPPYPTEHIHDTINCEADENVPIRGMDTDAEDIYWYDVKKDSLGSLCTAGAYGVVCAVLGFSSNPRAAMAKPLRELESLKLKDKQYRTDLERVFVKDLEKLEQMGVDINVYSEA